MNIRATKIGVLALTVVAFGAGSAIAKPVSVSKHPPDQVKASCDFQGETFWGRSGSSGTYGCLLDDGHGIVCGGKVDSKNCWTFRSAPQGRFPPSGRAAKSR
jgi:hypothetical protein